MFKNNFRCVKRGGKWLKTSLDVLKGVESG